jgi:hypothetical protein
MKNSNLINALIVAQSSIESVKNDATNPAFNSGYPTLKSVIDTVKKPLNENGIYFQQIAHDRDGGIGIETILHGHGDSLSSGVVPIPAVKTNPHGFGSALSYAKRYSLMLACGIASGDDDGNSAMQGFEQEPKVAKEKTVATKTTYSDAKF